MFKKILIANRGEIALRIMRTAKRLGVQTVAIYSDADAGSPHVSFADEAYPLGAGKSLDTYLQGERIIQIAKSAHAQAIHPGYGFLSENPDFVDAVTAAGIKFIGPSADAMRSLGHKDKARELAEKNKVPVVPGYQGAGQDLKTLAKEAERVGFPLMIKARAGGGGKGMRKVLAVTEVAGAIETAKREAMSSFGDEQLILERYVESARHVEVQLLADAAGTVLHFFERDCSVQRRHQKIIEEAPAPGLPEKLLEKIYAAALKVTKAAKLENAATAEFLVSPGSNEFFFLEVNPRLQVEHPVTEMTTGVDLVELQLRVASGEKLSLEQSAIKRSGSAIEARIYSEIPAKNFMPNIGRIAHLMLPPEAADLRIEHALTAGLEIGSGFDPMLAKVIAYGPTRDAALKRLREALSKFGPLGLGTNIGFLDSVLAFPAFQRAELTTGFVEQHLTSLVNEKQTRALAAEALSAALNFRSEHERALDAETLGADDPFVALRGTELIGPTLEYELFSYDLQERIYLTNNDAKESSHPTFAHPVSFYARDTARTYVRVGATSWLVQPKFEAVEETIEGADGKIRSPLPGSVISVAVSAGQAVSRGETLIVLESMKMEHALRAPSDGRVDEVLISQGMSVKQGELLLAFTAGV